MQLKAYLEGRCWRRGLTAMTGYEGSCPLQLVGIKWELCADAMPLLPVTYGNFVYLPGCTQVTPF